jgi:hypothetical protein
MAKSVLSSVLVGVGYHCDELVRQLELSRPELLGKLPHLEHVQKIQAH